jgi:uncharacterized metal-binding protein YceD (DUF177 family)
MKLNVNRIGPNGHTIELNEKDEWLIKLFNDIFQDSRYDKSSISGSLNLNKYDANISFLGNIKFKHFPLCARCGSEQTKLEDMQVSVNLAPLYTSKKDKEKQSDEEEEIELTKEDLDFSFYDDDEINIGSILNDEIILRIPYNYYCKDQNNCKLLGPTDPNITINDNTDPRWQGLKNLKNLKH